MAPPPTLPRRYQLHLHSDRLVFGWYDVTVSLYSLTAQRSRNKPKAWWKCLQGLWSYRARQCHRCWLYLEILRQKFLLHEYSNLRVLHNLNLYDKLNDMLILIVSYIWSIGGQTKRLPKEIDCRLPCIFSVTDHRWRQNVLITLVSDWPAPLVPFCVLTTFWRQLWFIAEQTDAQQHGISLPEWRILWKYIPVQENVKLCELKCALNISYLFLIRGACDSLLFPLPTT